MEKAQIHSIHIGVCPQVCLPRVICVRISAASSSPEEITGAPPNSIGGNLRPRRYCLLHFFGCTKMPQKASKRHRGSRVAQPIKGSLIDTGVERTPNVVQPPSLAALFPASMINVINTALKHTFTLAILLRAVLLIYAEWQDANFAVKYTDVDYKVFSDAAAAIVNGNSPFRRATYRYTPLLAYALVPNVGVPEWGIPAAPWFGKLLFVGADLAVGVLIRRVLLLRGMHIDMATRWSALYLFHPFSWTVSTRGNADGIVGALVLLSLYLAMQHRVVTSALVYGIAVHFKIYPIIYAPAFLVLFDRSTYRGIKTKPGPTKNTCPSFIRELLSPDRVTFGIVSGSVFLILGALFYFHFGYEFLYETYLYHLIRKDNRHNFSVYFYDLYLGFGGGNIGGVNSENVVGSHTLAFLPQFGVAIALALRFGKDLPFALATQTMAFVTFNKVSCVVLP